MAHDQNKLEFYETPPAFTRWLFTRVQISGRLFEPCVGDGAIPRAAESTRPSGSAPDHWAANDLDPYWAADSHLDATRTPVWDFRAVRDAEPDWTVSNPPFEPCLEIIDHAIRTSRVGVAMHLRASIHEVLKTGKRRTWMTEHKPNGILWLPRFAYQRSAKTGEWSTDSVCAAWVIWLKDPLAPQFIDYAPEWVLRELKADEPAYRARMDRLMAARKAAA